MVVLNCTLRLHDYKTFTANWDLANTHLRCVNAPEVRGLFGTNITRIFIGYSLHTWWDIVYSLTVQDTFWIILAY